MESPRRANLSMDSTAAMLAPSELKKLHEKVAYLRDQGDAEGAMQVQASLVQRYDVAESPEGDPPAACLTGPFRGSGSIGVEKKKVEGGAADDRAAGDGDNADEEDKGDDEDGPVSEPLLSSVPFDGQWYDDEEFTKAYSPTGPKRLRGLRFHQWMNIADMKFYQLKAEVEDVEPGSWFVSLLCCRHSWDPEPSSDEPSALIATTSVETPEYVQALPYSARRRIPLASSLRENTWGHIVAGVVAVPLGGRATVRATVHAEEKGWWRSGLVVHSMIITKLSTGLAQPILRTHNILKSEPDFKSSGLASPTANLTGRTADNDVPPSPAASDTSGVTQQHDQTRLFDATMSPVLGATGGVIERVNAQSKLEMLELRRQLWRSQEETRAVRSKLDVALANSTHLTSERREREGKAREDRRTEVHALRSEITRLQEEVEESRDLQRRYSSIEAQLRKSESEARRQADRAFKAMKEDQSLRNTLEDARREASENRLKEDAAVLKLNELRGNFDTVRKDFNEFKLVAEADNSRRDGIIADQEVLIKEKDESIKDNKEELEKKTKLSMQLSQKGQELESALLKANKNMLSIQHTLKIHEAAAAAAGGGGGGGGGGGTFGGPSRAPDDASAKQMDGVLAFLGTMISDRGFDSVLFEVADKAAAMLGASHAIVFKVDKKGRSLFSWGGDEDLNVQYRGGKGGLVGLAATQVQPIRVDNLEADGRAIDHELEFEARDDDEPQPTKSIMCSPITYFDEDGEETAAAVIEFYNKLSPSRKPIPFTLRDEIIAGTIASTVGSFVKVDDLVMDAIMEEDEEESDDDTPEVERTPEQLKRDLTKANLKIAELERKVAELEKNGTPGTKMKVAKSGPPSRAARKKKGQAIIQRSVAIETGKLVEIKRYAKEDYVQELILSTLKKNPIYCKFENCTPHELDQVVGAFEPHDVQKGVNLITQGEGGDFFYIIESGTFKILINLPDGTQKQVAIFKPGQGVGELALIQDAPRAATVQASTAARVWRLKRENCDIVTFLRKKRNEMCIRYMGSIKIPASAQVSRNGEPAEGAKDCTLKDLISESAIDGLVAQLTEEVFEPGVCIMQQGQRGDELFIIEEGVVDILIANAEQLKTGELGRKVAEIKDGTVFGEKALLGGDKRNASCVAQARVKAFRLARENFEKALGSVAELLSNQEANALIKVEDIPLRELQPFDIGKDLKVLKTLGRGTFGRVSLARHNTTGVLYALKAQAKANIVENKMEDRVLLEKRTLIRLQSDFITALAGCGQDKKYLYFVLDYLPGGELYTHLGRVTNFDEKGAQFFVAQMALALDHMHSRRMVYRDLKPENVCLDAQGYIKLVDFGMAKIINFKTWTFCGTPDYLAPEIVQQKGHDRGVDYWALGVVAYEMVHGVPPFCDEGGSAMKVYKKIVDGDLVFPDTFSSGLKEFCEGLMTINLGTRLGMLKEGTDDIKRHKWFTGFNYTQLTSRNLESPLKVELENDEDTKYFEEIAPGGEDEPADTEWVADLDSNDVVIESI